MTNNEDELFDLSLEEDADDFDPLADVELDDDIEDAPAESGVITADPAEFPTSDQLQQASDALKAAPPEKRIEVLFDDMRPFRKTLLNIIRAAEEPLDNDKMVVLIDGWQTDNKSVYDADNLCMMLTRAGAIKRITPEGEDYEQVVEVAEPETVIVDGTEYLKPTTLPAICWLATPEGLAVVEADKPAERLRELLEGEPQYSAVYRIVLDEAGKDDGTTEKTLGKLIDKRPEVQKPRMYAMRFANKLAEADALEWKQKAWHITDLGKQAYAILDEVDAAQAGVPSAQANEAETPSTAE